MGEQGEGHSHAPYLPPESVIKRLKKTLSRASEAIRTGARALLQPKGWGARPFLSRTPPHPPGRGPTSYLQRRVIDRIFLKKFDLGIILTFFHPSFDLEGRGHTIIKYFQIPDFTKKSCFLRPQEFSFFSEGYPSLFTSGACAAPRIQRRTRSSRRCNGTRAFLKAAKVKVPHSIPPRVGGIKAQLKTHFMFFLAINRFTAIFLKHTTKR